MTTATERSVLDRPLVYGAFMFTIWLAVQAAAAWYSGDPIEWLVILPGGVAAGIVPLLWKMYHRRMSRSESQTHE